MFYCTQSSKLGRPDNIDVCKKKQTIVDPQQDSQIKHLQSPIPRLSAETLTNWRMIF